jgi:hypothetical protein
MNDIAFFNDVLTSSEVSAIYNSGSPKDEEVTLWFNSLLYYGSL